MPFSQSGLGGDATLLGSRTDALPTEAGQRSAPLANGSTVGRYVVIGRLGRGAMGAVYRCYDPALDRQVALKLLAPSVGQSEGRRRRLLAEARALARVKHAHVVAVYDSGEHDGQVFIAMELVDGVTLRVWVANGRTQAETLAVFAQAARGLGAAHEAGLIHRDFKPDNVMVERGTARAVVMDFGIARSLDATPSEVRDAASDTDNKIAASMDLTRSGAVLGTPAYMSPEQVSRRSLSPASDQFSFCVTLFEALDGERPFAGERLTVLATALLHKRPSTLRARAPRRIRDAIARGLARNPEDRFERMEELAVALEPRTAPLRAIIGVLVLGGVAAGAAAGLVSPDDAQDRCDRGAASVSEVWNADRSERIDGEFAKLQVAYTEATWSRASAILDAYAIGWTDAFSKACSTSLVRGERSAALFDRQAACLTSHRDRLGATLGEVERADEETARGVVSLVTNLESPEVCLELAGGDGQPHISEGEQEGRIALAKMKVDFFAGRFDAATQAAAALLKSTSDLDAPLFRAEVQLFLGRSRKRLGELPEALNDFERALAELAPLDNARTVTMRVWDAYISALGTAESRVEESHTLLLAAELAAGGNAASAADRVRLDRLRATVAVRRGRPREGVEHARAAVLLVTSAGLTDNLRVHALRALSRSQFAAGEIRASVDTSRQVVALVRASFGAKHPRVSEELSHLSIGCRKLADLDCARKASSEAIEILEPLGASMEVDLAMARLRLGYVAYEDGDHGAAHRFFVAAAEVLQRRLPAGDRRITAAAVAVSSASETPAEKLEWLERAEKNALVGSRPDITANLLNRRAVVVEEDGELAAALILYQRSLKAYATSGEGHGGCAPALNISEVLVKLNRASEAIEAGREALGICSREDGSEFEQGSAHFSIAQALLLPGPTRDVDQARTEGGVASELLAKAGADDTLDKVDALLAKL